MELEEGDYLVGVEIVEKDVTRTIGGDDQTAVKGVRTSSISGADTLASNDSISDTGLKWSVGSCPGEGVAQRQLRRRQRRIPFLFSRRSG